MTRSAKAPAPFEDLAGEGATALLVLMPWLEREAQQAARAAGALTLARARMLHVLTEGSRRGSEIAARWHISRAAVAEAAASLVKDGFIRRVADREDGRAVRFVLTAKGRREMESFGLATIGALGRHVARLTPAKQRALRDAARELLPILVAAAGEGSES